MKKKSRLGRLPLPRRPLEWGLSILAVALVVIAITSLGSSSSSSSAATKRTSTVGKGVVQSTVSGNGTLEPAQKVELSFGASGEVTNVYVKAGEKVKKGQVLAEVDSSSARASLASAEAALLEAEEAVESAEEAEEEEAEEEEAEAEEEEAEAEEAAYTGGATTEFVGLMSESGTAAAKTETESTTGASEEATATEEGTTPETGSTAEEKAKKEAAAKEKEAASKAKAAAEKEAASEATKESVGTPSASESGSSSEASTESSGGSTESSSSGGATGGATISLPTAEANLREAQLTVKSARQEVRETTLRAPISGTIASISGSVGETVSGGSSSGGTSEASVGAATGGESSSSGSGSAFLVLAQLHRLKMEVSFSESDIGKVRKGQTATVSIDSMEGTELAGEITKVSVLPDESGTVVEYPATILLTQSAKGVRTGMSASAEVVVEQVKNAVTVPTEAITAAGSGKTVTVEEDGKEVTKTIKTGLEGDETTEVISGLKAGQTLILPEVQVATTTESSGEGKEESGSFPSFGSSSGGFTPPGGGGFLGGGGAP